MAVLLGCGLRRAEVAALTVVDLQQRDGRWMWGEFGWQDSSREDCTRPVVGSGGSTSLIYIRRDHGAVFFGKSQGHRWDAPKSDYGVLYLGADARCAFLEFIGRGVLRTRRVQASQFQTRQLAKKSIFAGSVAHRHRFVGRINACGNGRELGERSGIPQLSTMVGRITVSLNEGRRHLIPISLRSGPDLLRAL